MVVTEAPARPLCARVTSGQSDPFPCSEVRTVTLIPGDGIGPEIAVAVQKIFAAAEVESPVAPPTS